MCCDGMPPPPPTTSGEWYSCTQAQNVLERKGEEGWEMQIKQREVGGKEKKKKTERWEVMKVNMAREIRNRYTLHSVSSSRTIRHVCPWVDTHWIPGSRTYTVTPCVPVCFFSLPSHKSTAFDKRPRRGSVECQYDTIRRCDVATNRGREYA